MNVLIVAALFLSFAVGINWIASDKEKADMKKALSQTKLVIKDVEQQMMAAQTRLDRNTSQLEELEAKYREKYKAESAEEKKRLSEALLKAEEARLIAEKKAESDIAAAKQQGREIQGAQNKSSELETRLLAIEEAVKKLEAKAEAEKQAKLQAEEELRQKAEAVKTGEDDKSGQLSTTVDLKSGENLQEDAFIKYTVVEGDTLWTIAGKESVYNASKLWVVIYIHNRDQLKDPNYLYPGQVLLIPKKRITNQDAIDAFLKTKSALEEAQ
ncbi:MAG: LysM peptidoglycan-binding domain-containing protein [Deltaproteobacteria bacterium]|nr:LysM peptidoglycan-binding domain-containing protein [Deltaproteobacteria bacterium]